MQIAMMTDFGLDDIYAGVMKGVIHGIAPGTPLIDITHQIDRQNVRQAAFALRNACPYFPAGTIFLVVVDPGVGSTRKPIVVQTSGYTFVAPDNGVLSYSLDEFSDYVAVELSNPAYHLPKVSNTFHGRDIFAPAAAHLAAGVTLDELGPALDRIVQLPPLELTVSDQLVRGEVVHIDHFGNVTTSIGHLRWNAPERLILSVSGAADMPVLATSAEITLNEHRVSGIRLSYSEALRGDVLALVGSSSYLEIAVNQGSAAERLDVSIGDRVELQVGDVNAAIRD
jgi:S-adenosyl-L-methionine hydrolase (adenosine-forming)